jgi:hypothetical protein
MKQQSAGALKLKNIFAHFALRKVEVLQNRVETLKITNS